jgi:hypothetical protein
METTTKVAKRSRRFMAPALLGNDFCRGSQWAIRAPLGEQIRPRGALTTKFSSCAFCFAPASRTGNPHHHAHAHQMRHAV